MSKASSTAELELERQRVQALLDTWQARRHLGADDWQAVAEEAHARARQLGEPVLLAHSLLALGYARVLRLECPAALELASEALGLLEGQDQPDLVANAHQLQGRAYYDLGDDETALACFERALEQVRDPGLRLRLRGNVAAISIELGHLGQAVEALEHLLADPLHTHRANTHSNLAIALFRLAVEREQAGAVLEAQALLERAEVEVGVARELAQQSAQRDIEAHAGVTLADLLEHRGEAQRALEHYQEAIRVAETHGFPWPELQARINLGGLEVKQGRYQEALGLLSAALERAEALGFREQASRLHQHLADAHAALGQHREAFEHFRRFHDLDVGVRSEAAARRVEVLGVRWQVERARLEAQLAHERSEALIRLNAQLERQASTDPLTGLANRRAFTEHYGRVFATALETASTLTVVLVDLDHFKGVNDRFSHAVGDEVLRAFAWVLSTHCRADDMVARYGGEEFVVVLPGLSGTAAFAACERLRAATEAFDWEEVQAGLRQTASFGFCDDLSLADPHRLLEVADQHLYAAKRNGRNRVWPQP